LFGGQDSFGASSETWEWDGANWSNAHHGDGTFGAINGHNMAYDNIRHVTVLFGGYNGSCLSNETWEWDGTTWKRRSPLVSPSERLLPAMAFDSVRGVCVLFGGAEITGTGQTSSGIRGEWDGKAWTQLGSDEGAVQSCGPDMFFDSRRGDRFCLAQ